MARSVRPVRTRRLYFSEKLEDPSNSNSATTFYLTVEARLPRIDPASTEPNIIARQGDVEDWIIENRSSELHAFISPGSFPAARHVRHAWSTSIPARYGQRSVFQCRMLKFPSVRLRMDFRDPNASATSCYHCHLLEHEDGGMMGLIRVEPSGAARPRLSRGRVAVAVAVAVARRSHSNHADVTTPS